MKHLLDIRKVNSGDGEKFKMEKEIVLPCGKPSTIEKWFIRKGKIINQGTIICSYKVDGSNEVLKFRSTQFGTVTELLAPVETQLEKGCVFR